MENLARYVDKEVKTEIELIIRAYLVAWIFQVANTTRTMVEALDSRAERLNSTPLETKKTGMRNP